MLSLGIIIRDRIKDRIRQNKITPATKKEGGTTLVQSSKLINSIRSWVKGNDIIVGTNIKYAKIHHEGGTIHPVKAKYLAIPIHPMARLKSPRDFEDTFIKDGIIYYGGDKKEKAVALYALKKQVTIPARPYMYLDAQDKEVIIEHVQKWVLRQLSHTN